MTITAGGILAVTEAIRGDQQNFRRDLVAYLVAVAYRSGLAHGHAYDVAELLATWDEKQQDPPTREDRIAAELASYGPAGFDGGLPKPATYFPPDEDRVAPRFPRLEEQAAWLSAEDVAFCRRYAAENYGAVQLKAAA